MFKCQSDTLKAFHSDNMALYYYSLSKWILYKCLQQRYYRDVPNKHL